MTLFQLHVFLAVVESGSFTKAGERIGLSQSGVSHTIAALEEDLGISLLHRSRSGIKLTEAGERIVTHVRTVLQQTEQIKQVAAQAAGLQIGTIRIGTFPSVSAKLLPGILRTYRSRYPGVEISLFEGSYPEIEEWIRAGVVDVGFTPFPVEELDAVVLAEDPLKVVLPAQHPLSEQPFLQLEQLAEEPFIMPMAGCERLVGEAFRGKGLNPDIQFEVADTSTILAMVEAGIGVTVVPELTLPRNLPNVKVVELVPQVLRRIGLAVRSQDQSPPAVKAFIAEAQKWVSSPS